MSTTDQTAPQEGGNYLLWLTERQGWLAIAGGTTTDIASAQRFSRATAIDIAKKHVAHDGSLGAIPTHLGLVEELRS